MSLADTIAQAGGQAAIAQVASQFGLDQQTAAQAVGMLLPAISSGMQRNAAQPSGLGALLGALQGGNHARYLEEPSLLSGASSDGVGILGHVLGSKDVSRAVAATVAGALGIENDTVKKMLPIVAALAMAGLAKQQQAQPIEAPAEPAAAPGGAVLGQLGKMLGSGGAGKILGGLFS